jgi:hypothetical protein
MQFPNATAADWTHALSIVKKLLGMYGIFGPDQDDAAQHWALKVLERKSRSENPPDSPQGAAYQACAQVRKYGIASLLPHRSQPTATRRRNGQSESQPEAQPLGHRDTSPGSLNPATIAELADGGAYTRGGLAAAAKASGLSPAEWTRQALGYCLLDADDATRATPSVQAVGPGYTPPTKGIRGLHTDTDPNRASAAAAVLAAVNDWRRVAGLDPIAAAIGSIAFASREWATAETWRRVAGMDPIAAA